MKNCKVILLLFVAVMLSMPAFAQEVAEKAPKLSAKKMAKQTAEAVSKMDKEQQQMILNYTRNLKEVDVKKELTKALKKMSAEDRQKVMSYITKVEKSKEVKEESIASKIKPMVPSQVQSKAEAKATVKPNAKPKVKTPATPVDPATLTTIEILDPTYDFGTITQGDKASTTYRIKNTGTMPLKISKAKGSCGCTVPVWPKEAIAPGEIANIDVVFNSRGKKGKQNKRITITANTDPAQNYMTITGTVEMPAKQEAPKPGKQ